MTELRPRWPLASNSSNHRLVRPGSGPFGGVGVEFGRCPGPSTATRDSTAFAARSAPPRRLQGFRYRRMRRYNNELRAAGACEGCADYRRTADAASITLSVGYGYSAYGQGGKYHGPKRLKGHAAEFRTPR